MTKSELIARLAERNPRLVARDADEAVNTMLDAMTDALASGQRIEIRGFGSFALNYRPPRVGRNPKSGDRVQVPAKYVPHFKAGKELRERVDGEEESSAPGGNAAEHRYSCKAAHRAAFFSPARTGHRFPTMPTLLMQWCRRRE